MKNTILKMTGFVFIRLFVCTVAVILIVYVLERSAFISNDISKALFLILFAVCASLHVASIVTIHIRNLTEEALAKKSEEAFSSCLEASRNLQLIAKALEDHSMLIGRFAHMIVQMHADNDE